MSLGSEGEEVFFDGGLDFPQRAASVLTERIERAGLSEDAALVFGQSAAAEEIGEVFPRRGAALLGDDFLRGTAQAAELIEPEAEGGVIFQGAIDGGLHDADRPDADAVLPGVTHEGGR